MASPKRPLLGGVGAAMLSIRVARSLYERRRQPAPEAPAGANEVARLRGDLRRELERLAQADRDVKASRRGLPAGSPR